jgi:hypothetical protein
MTTISNIASTIDDLVHRELGQAFDMSARLYATDPDGAWLIGSADDPYDLFDATRPRGTTAVGFVCTGWAAPTDDGDTPPSQNPERVRIRITVAYNGSEWTTIMRRQDTDETMVMEEAGVGRLADAIANWWDEAEVIF